MRDSHRLRTWRTHIGLALILTGAVAISDYRDWLRRWNWLAYDVLLRIDAREALDDLLIIAIDQQSLAQLGR